MPIDLTPEKRAELRRLAEASKATWHMPPPASQWWSPGSLNGRLSGQPEDAAFIAALEPGVVLSLLDALDRRDADYDDIAATHEAMCVAKDAELAELRGATVICPHCFEAVSEDVGVEGPKGNLWHPGCLDSWREEP